MPAIVPLDSNAPAFQALVNALLLYSAPMGSVIRRLANLAQPALQTAPCH
jgi:hypothetical protein